jgi:uncharacterized protein YyaL (SSP411 family)
VDAAARAARFVDRELVRDGRLLRHYRDGAADVPAFLDDLAFMGRGYAALYEATFDPSWLERALWAADEIRSRFSLPEGGFRMSADGAQDLVAPAIETYDGALPSGNAAAAGFLLRLGHLTGDSEVEESGRRVLERFGGLLARNPEAHLEMLSALDFHLGPRSEIVVAGRPDDPAVHDMWASLRRRHLPNAVVAFRPEQEFEKTVELIPFLAAHEAIGGRPTAYVCRNYACRLPVHDAAALAAELENGRGVASGRDGPPGFTLEKPRDRD